MLNIVGVKLNNGLQFEHLLALCILNSWINKLIKNNS